MQKNSAYGNTFFPTEAFLQQVTFSIGGISIDVHTNTWFRIFSELFRKADEKRAYQRLNDYCDGEGDGTIKRMYLPLLFFWNRSVGMSLPLIALQYHECRLDFQFANSVPGIDPAYQPTIDVYIDYVFLDAMERRRVASQAQEVLYDQVQFSGDESITIANNAQKQQNIRLQLNHPVKLVAMVACTQDHGIFTGGPAGTTADAFAPISQVTLQFNGSNRLSPRYGSYFGQVVPYQTCQTLPMAGIYAWSPALDPAAHQPSGSANFSRIDNAQVQIKFKQAATNASAVHDVLTPDTITVAAASNLNILRIHGFGYNILRIMGGMAAPAYSN